VRSFTLVVDCRMNLSSSIGVYVQKLLPWIARTIPPQSESPETARASEVLQSAM
jgi:hypothetical protein